MIGGPRWRRLSTALLALVPAIWPPSAPDAPDAPDPGGRDHAEVPGAEQRGRAIYLSGVSPAEGQILAELGAGGIVVPAATLPCGGCHGADGRGRPEGGVAPSNVRWEALSRPYRVVEGSGRDHPPYTERSLGRAVTLGIDPAGNPLDGAMPRFRLTRGELSDLIAYLKVLGKERAPGVDDVSLRIGTVLATAGPRAEAARAVESALRAFFDEVNRQGGVYGRRIVLHPIEATAEAVRAALDEAQPFALTSVFAESEDQSAIEAAEERRVPVVGAISLAPRTVPLPRYVFQLYPGLAEQGRVLCAFAARDRARGARVTFVHGGAAASAAGRAAEACRRSASGEVRSILVPEGGPQPALGLSSSREEVLVFLGPAGAARDLWEALPRSGARPLFLAPGALAGEALREAPPALADRLFVSLSSLPSDRDPEAIATYRRLAEAHALPSEHVSEQLSALAAAEILVEGLKRSGREVSREALVEALEGLHEFRTGFTPPVTYGKNRRIGVLGAHVVPVDRSARGFSTQGPWIPAD